MLKPFFCYFGGKWRAAPHYPAPKYNTIVEPFAGAAGYATRYHAAQVFLYDADPVIVGVWDYLIHASCCDIISLPDVPADGSTDDLAVCQEAKWLIGFWLNGGSAQPKKRPSAWMKKAAAGAWGGGQLCWGPRVRQRLADQVGAIRHWRVKQAKFSDLTTQVPCTWFVDPPYQEAGKFYRFSSAGLDFEALGEWCRDRRGQVIVCENEGADWLPFRPFRTIKGAAGARRSGKSVEVIWTRDDAVRVLDPDDPMLQ